MGSIFSPIGFFVSYFICSFLTLLISSIIKKRSSTLGESLCIYLLWPVVIAILCIVKFAKIMDYLFSELAD